MSKPRVVIVHGIHTNDDEAWMAYLEATFKRAGWDAHVWTYGNVSWWSVRFLNASRAKKLAAIIQPGDVLLAHSNGCTLTWMASHRGAPISGAILLNPALDTEKVLAPQVKWVNLYFNKDDTAVGLAGIFIDHPWGPQGRDGISVNDIRYLQVPTHDGHPPVSGHSDVLTPEKLPRWTERFIADAERRIREHTV